MALYSEKWIESLIENSSDLQANMFEVTLVLEERENPTTASESFQYRVKNFNAPSLGHDAINLPFQNSEFPIGAPSDSSDKTLDFEVRLDDAFELYKFLKSRIRVDTIGKWSSTTKTCTIKVKALRVIDGDYKQSHLWEFHDCILVNFPQLGFGYENSGGLSVTVSFKYQYYTET